MDEIRLVYSRFYIPVRQDSIEFCTWKRYNKTNIAPRNQVPGGGPHREREVHKMTDRTLDILKQASVDVEEALAHFSGHSRLYEKFLIKFLQDDCFKRIEGAVKARDLSLIHISVSGVRKSWETALSKLARIVSFSASIRMWFCSFK